MPGSGRVVVCLPTYNERETLERMVRTLVGVLPPGARVLVIDDGSPDGTGEIADRLARELEQVEVSHRLEKQGLGPAYIEGFRRALAEGADLVVTMDCDFSHDPNDVPRLLDAAASSDVVIGSRYVDGGGTRGWPLLRRLVSRGGSRYAAAALGLGVSDLTGGFKCYRREVLEAIDLDSLEARGYAFQVEMTYRAAQAGFSVTEVPIVFTDRQHGTSKMTASIALEALWRVPLMRLDRVRRAAYRRILTWWLVSRAIVFACAAAAQVSGWPRPHWHPSLLNHPFAALSVWDGRWYRIIAERGYLLVPGRQSDPAFFPLLPVVERGLAAIGIPPMASGIVIANLAFPIGLFVLYELSRHFLPEPDARRTVLYLAFFPLSYVFSMAYPEALVLPLIAGAGLAALRRRWGIAAVCMSLATFGRPEGLFLMLPLIVVAARGWHALRPRQRASAVAAVLAGPATLGLFSLYLWRTLGDPLAWSKAEGQWGRHFSATGVYKAFAQVAHAVSHHNTWLYRDAVFCLIYVVLLIVASRAGVSRSWLIAATAVVLLPLASGTVTSDARFGLLAFAAFWGLAVAGRNRLVNRFVWTVSPVMLALAVLTIPVRFP